MLSLPKSNWDKIKSFFKNCGKLILWVVFSWIILTLILFTTEPVFAGGAVTFTLDEENSYHQMYDGNSDNVDKCFMIATVGFYSYVHDDYDVIHFEFMPNQTVFNVHMWVVPYDCSKDSQVDQREDYIFYPVLLGDQTVIYDKSGYAYDSQGLRIYIRYDYNSTHVGYSIMTLHNLGWSDITNPKKIAKNAIESPVQAVYDWNDVVTTVVSEVTGQDIPNPLAEGVSKAGVENATFFEDLEENSIVNNPATNIIYSIADLVELFSDFITLYKVLSDPQTLIFDLFCLLGVWIGFKSITTPGGNPIIGIVFILMFGGFFVASVGNVFGIVPD